ncbi:hypothetical protein ZYGR_0BB01470 [Zygosaccharomyces rouxii]|uniref:Vacuolar protein sorting-associated protein 51 homolog n=1 Tax=Zygosaccharomyces rouxii TaxID=4956 RepID=A0A1Q3AL55_ZYGRO|nr:hypothetical protein ZYGR_0BB01470 [Zygosaccharomyces rouxii]
MTEQISHKKSLRKVNKERRAQLKEYYKLEEDEEDHKGTESKSDASATPSHVQEDKPIEQLNFQELVRTHNRLLSKETEMNNSIKNTIYENYYDLIKVNDLLKSMTGSNEKELSQLKEAVKLLEE